MNAIDRKLGALTDDAIRQSLLEMQAEFDTRFGTRANPTTKDGGLTKLLRDVDVYLHDKCSDPVADELHARLHDVAYALANPAPRLEDAEVVERLRAALESCANALESELQARYPVEAEGRSPFPTMQRRYERDMADVIDARAALAALSAQSPISGRRGGGSDPHMKPGPIGSPAEILNRLAGEHKVSLAALSRMIRRRPTFLAKFIREGHPAKLETWDREVLAAYFRVPEWWFGEDG